MRLGLNSPWELEAEELAEFYDGQLTSERRSTFALRPKSYARGVKPLVESLRLAGRRDWSLHALPLAP